MIKRIILTFVLCIMYSSTVYAYDINDEESVLMQQIAIAEAECDGIIGMALVMKVILNRVESDEFPETITDVIEQERQFASYESGIYTDKTPTDSSKKAIDLLKLLKDTDALFFENPDITKSKWQEEQCTPVLVYKNHAFYK